MFHPPYSDHFKDTFEIDKSFLYLCTKCTRVHFCMRVIQVKWTGWSKAVQFLTQCTCPPWWTSTSVLFSLRCLIVSRLFCLARLCCCSPYGIHRRGIYESVSIPCERTAVTLLIIIIFIWPKEALYMMRRKYFFHFFNFFILLRYSKDLMLWLCCFWGKYSDFPEGEVRIKTTLLTKKWCVIVFDPPKRRIRLLDKLNKVQNMDHRGLTKEVGRVRGGPFKTPNEKTREHYWNQMDSLGIEGKLKVPGLDLYDSLRDCVLHDEECGSRKRKEYDKTKAF